MQQQAPSPSAPRCHPTAFATINLDIGRKYIAAFWADALSHAFVPKHDWRREIATAKLEAQILCELGIAFFEQFFGSFDLLFNLVTLWPFREQGKSRFETIQCVLASADIFRDILEFHGTLQEVLSRVGEILFD